jgi:hypothetical protein
MMFIEYDLHPFVRLLHGWLVFLYHCYFLDIIYFVNLCRYTYIIIKRQKKIQWIININPTKVIQLLKEHIQIHIKKEERLKAPPY